MLPTLHMLPAEAPHDTADLILSPQALDKLLRALQRAQDTHHAVLEFNQRDGAPYELSIQVIDAPHSSHDWRHIPMAYMRHQARHVLYDYRNRPYDADLLSAHLYAARKARRHNQKTAAATIGVAVGFISNVENCRYVPRPENFKRLCSYIGSVPKDYLIPGDLTENRS